MPHFLRLPPWQFRLLAATLLFAIFSSASVDRGKLGIDLLQECEDLELEESQEEALDGESLSCTSLPSLSITLSLHPGCCLLNLAASEAEPFTCQHFARPPPNSRT